MFAPLAVSQTRASFSSPSHSSLLPPSSSRSSVSSSPTAAAAAAAAAAKQAELLSQSASHLILPQLTHSQSSSSSQLQLESLPAIADCTVCFEPFSLDASPPLAGGIDHRPRTLACGHSFCSNCLKRQIKIKKTCFECRKPIAFASIGAIIIAYPVLDANNRIIALQRQLEAEADKVPKCRTDNCRAVAIVYCEEFNVELCGVHRHSIPGHRCAPIDQKREIIAAKAEAQRKLNSHLCLEHEGEMMRRWCFSCKARVCNECLLHGRHQGHKTDLLTVAAASRRNEIARWEGEVKSANIRTAEEEATRMSQLVASVSAARTAIAAATDAIVNLATERRAELESQLDDIIAQSSSSRSLRDSHATDCHLYRTHLHASALTAISYSDIQIMEMSEGEWLPPLVAERDEMNRVFNGLNAEYAKTIVVSVQAQWVSKDVTAIVEVIKDTFKLVETVYPSPNGLPPLSPPPSRGSKKVRPAIATLAMAGQSKIVMPKHQSHLMRFFAGVRIPAMSLIYRASADGFDRKDILRRCSSRGPTITLVKCIDKNRKLFVFGAYTGVAWPSLSATHDASHQRVHVADHSGKSFLFSLENRQNRPVRLKLIKKEKCIGVNAMGGASFGEMLFLNYEGRPSNHPEGNSCNSAVAYWLDVPCETQAGLMPPVFSYDKYFFAGTERFQASEIEMYQIEESTIVNDHRYNYSATDGGPEQKEGEDDEEEEEEEEGEESAGKETTEQEESA